MAGLESRTNRQLQSSPQMTGNITCYKEIARAAHFWVAIMGSPYAEKPPYQFWRRSVSGVRPQDLDPITETSFSISPSDRVATAGSCFAQHIARHIQSRGFNYFVSEDKLAHGGGEGENYGVFSARYGNIYTARQLLQLFQRAYGLYQPKVDHWTRLDGRIIDPFRPRIESRGFATIDDLLKSRDIHLSCVRDIFERSDVFIFTLGLTEAWISVVDKAVYPLAPGTLPLTDNYSNAAFHNFSVGEIVADLEIFVEQMRVVNPLCRIILTVSPVPLIATYESKHVLLANSFSKASLLAAAVDVANRTQGVDYFPSFEIISSHTSRGIYFSDDAREVTDAGVAHVMELFERHYLVEEEKNSSELRYAANQTPLVNALEWIAQNQNIICDEEQIEDSLSYE